LAEPAPAYTIEHRRIRLADDVFVYVQRTLAPAGLLSPEIVPRSYGIAPTAASPSGTVVSAVGPGEAVWLGFEAVDRARPAIVRVRVDQHDPLDAVTGGPWKDLLSEEPRNYLMCPPEYRLAGARRGEHYRAFGLGEDRVDDHVFDRLSVLSRGDVPSVVTLELVTLARFTNLTGLDAEPLDPESAYKGWRLP
jgi:hypothetical protein